MESEKEVEIYAIRRYADIQRIKKYGMEELEYQEKLVKAELQSYGISVEELEF